LVSLRHRAPVRVGSWRTSASAPFSSSVASAQSWRAPSSLAGAAAS